MIKLSEELPDDLDPGGEPDLCVECGAPLEDFEQEDGTCTSCNDELKNQDALRRSEFDAGLVDSSEDGP